MNWNLKTLLTLFSSEDKGQVLKQGLHGLEKESLRVSKTGHLALTAHPESLGSSLSNPEITTDFSESQLELITAPYPSISEAIHALKGIQAFVLKNVEDEHLWPWSMPPILPKNEEDIPIARYGDSDEAKMKERYREGLAQRYGKHMQMLSGIHYNFSVTLEFWEMLLEELKLDLSLQELINEGYLHLLRNFARHRWLLIYLFGATPVFHESYQCEMVRANKDRAIALRMSRCGYANSAKIHVDYNSFKGHLESLKKATSTVHSPYSKLDPNKQLNDHLLQIANEYYFPIRLKPTTRVEDLLVGLEEKGVQYIEVRLFDLNPLEALSLTEEQLKFTHLFLMFCLMKASPKLTDKEIKESTDRQQAIALHGRNPDVPVEEWAEDLLKKMEGLAELMGYEDLLQNTKEKVKGQRPILSEQILNEMEQNEENFIEFGLRKSQEHRTHLLNGTH